MPFDGTTWTIDDAETGYGSIPGVRVRDRRGYILAVAIGDVPELDAAANGCLIAAAPDLLAAKKRMLADLREVEMTGFCGRTRLQQIIDLDAAIAKAEGR